MSTMGYYVNDILDKHSGVQILSDAKIGSRTKLLATDGYCATGYSVQPWVGQVTTVATSAGCDTATGNRLSSAYSIFLFATAAQYYLLPYPHPGYMIYLDCQRSSDVIFKTDIAGSGTGPVGGTGVYTYSWSSYTTGVAFYGTAVGPMNWRLVGISTSVWKILNTATAGTTQATSS
jgi:hypothetical protein